MGHPVAIEKCQALLVITQFKPGILAFLHILIMERIAQVPGTS
jgi:hypothetical protein